MLQSNFHPEIPEYVDASHIILHIMVESCEIWAWVKTLVPSEPQNSWDSWMFIPLKICIYRYWPIPQILLKSMKKTRRIHVCYIWIYMVTFTINIPPLCIFMLAYIPAPWILWERNSPPTWMWRRLLGHLLHSGIARRASGALEGLLWGTTALGDLTGSVGAGGSFSPAIFFGTGF